MVHITKKLITKRMRRPVLIYATLASLSFSATFLASAPLAFANEKSEQIKAVFLFKFFDYVTWSPDKNTDLRICIIGSYKFESSLEYIATKKNEYKIVQINDMSQTKNCHILYIGNTSHDALGNTPKNAGILTVGKQQNFHASGGAIRMYEKDRKIKLSISLKNVEAQNLKISSKLLDIADVKD